MADVTGIDSLQPEYINTWITEDYESAINKVRSELWKIYVSWGGDIDDSNLIDDSISILEKENVVKADDVYIEIRSM